MPRDVKEPDGERYGHEPNFPATGSISVRPHFYERAAAGTADLGLMTADGIRAAKIRVDTRMPYRRHSFCQRLTGLFGNTQ